MSDESQDYNSQGSIMNNIGFQAAGVMQIRLDVKPIVDDFESYLRGFVEVTTQDSKGMIKTQRVVRGSAIVNDYGYQALMQYVNMMINTQSVQGNFTDIEQYGEYLCRARKDLATFLMINRRRFGLNTNDYPGLMAAVMRLTEIFMTRQIGNKERDSYGATMRTVESLQSKPSGGGGFSIPFLGGWKK